MQRPCRMFEFLLMAACIAAIGCRSAAAQQVTGSVVGNVVDTQGGAIGGAQVTATNIDTNLSRTVSTNAQGEYRLEFLPPGSYRIEVAATGVLTIVLTGAADMGRAHVRT